MRPIWFIYAALGILFVGLVFIVSLGNFTWWYLVYYIILAFLGLLAIYYPQPRWSFIIGVIIGLGVLILLYSNNYLNYETRLFFLQRYIEPVW